MEKLEQIKVNGNGELLVVTDKSTYKTNGLSVVSFCKINSIDSIDYFENGFTSKLEKIDNKDCNDFFINQSGKKVFLIDLFYNTKKNECFNIDNM